MKSFIAISVLGLLMLLSFAVSAKTNMQGSFTTTDYERFSILSSEELYKKAAEYIQDDNVPDSALLCYTIILNRYDNGDIDHKEMSYVSGSLINLGFLYQDKYYDYSRAYDYLLRSLELAETQNSDYDKPYIYLGMASVLQYVDSDGSSLPTPLHLVKKALGAAIDNNDLHTVAISAINLCDLAFERSDTSIIADEIRLTEAYLDKNNKSNKMLMPYLRAYHAVCKDDYDAAIEALDEASGIDFSDRSLSEKYRFFTAQQKYRVLRMAKRPAEAEQVLKELLKESQTYDFQEFTLFALRELFALCHDEKRPEDSSEYEYRYLRMNDSINKTSNLLRVKDVVFANDIGHARLEVTRLKTEKNLQLIIIVAVSLIALLIATLLIYYIRTQRKLKESNLALYNQIQELLHARDEQTALREASESTGKDSTSRLPDERGREIYNRVLTLLDTSPEIFSPDFSIKTLADMIGEPYYDVSAAINNCSGTNFKALLLNYRIREACRRLSDESNYGNQTMEAIALGLGFKSRTYFNAVFKKQTGLTPTLYMGIAREKNNASE